MIPGSMRTFWYKRLTTNNWKHKVKNISMSHKQQPGTCPHGRPPDGARPQYILPIAYYIFTFAYAHIMDQAWALAPPHVQGLRGRWGPQNGLGPRGKPINIIALLIPIGYNKSILCSRLHFCMLRCPPAPLSAEQARPSFCSCVWACLLENETLCPKHVYSWQHEFVLAPAFFIP